jgi:hypothetical protein
MVENVQIISNVFLELVIKEEQMHALAKQMVNIAVIIQNVVSN